MPEIRSIILIIPLTLNGLNNTIKKQRLSDYIKKNTNEIQWYAIYRGCSLH